MGRISELPSAESLSDDDLLVLVQGGRTKKISRILEILKEKIGTKLVNNLLATEAGKAALDAAMGKVLADRCAALETEVAALNGKTDISINDLFESLVSDVASAEICKKGDHVYVHLLCNGSAQTAVNGAYQIGTLKSKYRPKSNQGSASFYNSGSSGQMFKSVNVYIGKSGYVGLYVGEANKTFGSTSYPWCTTSGISFDYELL